MSGAVGGGSVRLGLPHSRLQPRPLPHCPIFWIYFDHTTATISRYLLNRGLVNRDNKIINLTEEDKFIKYLPPTLNKFHLSEYENINDYFFYRCFADKILTPEEVNKKKKKK